MNKDYKGVIIEESLEDNIVLNDFDVVSLKITDDVIFSERWHLFTVQMSKQEIEKLPKLIKSGWYTHFLEGQRYHSCL